MISTMNNFTCNDLKQWNTYYITPGLSIVSIVFNMACFVTFARSSLNKYARSNMFKYLEAKSLLDVLEVSARLLKLVYNAKTLRHALVSSLLRILVGDYFKSVLSMLTIVIELFADINRLLEMRNSASAWRHVKHFRMQIVGIVSITCLIYTYGLFEKRLTTFRNYKNETLYDAIEGDFGNSVEFKYIKLVNGIVRDIICVCLLIVIDALILIELRRIMKRKKRILSNNSNNNFNNNNNPLNSSETTTSVNKSLQQSAIVAVAVKRQSASAATLKAELAEKRLTQMVLVKSAVRVCGHIPYFFKYIPCLQINTCFREFGAIFFIVSDTVNIFIYYKYNRVFREYLKGCFRLGREKRSNRRRHDKSSFHSESLNEFIQTI